VGGATVGGDMDDDQRKVLGEATVRMIARKMIDGLAALHENEIVHRDIKPQNVLLCDDVLVR
jgi:serine/threonine protein kinase